MAIYQYRCRECGYITDTQYRGDALGPCTNCEDGVMRRVWSVSLPRPMQEHFNKTVGKGISDPRQFQRELRKAGEQYTERTGIETDYQVSSPAEQQVQPKKAIPPPSIRHDDLRAVVRKLGGDID